jgi:hypothetical protein
MKHPVVAAAALIPLLFGLGCARGKAPQLDTTLVTTCHGFPDERPTRANHAEVGLRLQQGDRAVDFTLSDVDGTEHTLSALLATKPVLLVQGSWTCPRFQERRPGLETLQDKYGDDVHVVIVYNIEAHPPDGVPTPYHGKPRPREYSDKQQPKTLKERIDNARPVAEASDALVLVDDLGPGRNNPVWCTYGTCASCSWLIDQQGNIVASHDWHDNESMDRSIAALLEAGR